MKKYSITFTREYSFDLYAPDGMTDEEVQNLADSVAYNRLDDWFVPDWEAYASTASETDNRDLYSEHVVSDDKTDIIVGSDASWWKP